jgi:hypothetical protein
MVGSGARRVLTLFVACHPGPFETRTSALLRMRAGIQSAAALPEDWAATRGRGDNLYLLTGERGREEKP